MIDLTEAKARVERYRLDWEAKYAERKRMLESGERVPDGYWQAEHKARALYASALALLEALEEVS